MQLYGRFLSSNLPLDLRYYKCHMPDGLSQTLDKQLPLNKQFAFPGNVTSDSHVNGAALGSSTAALLHWRPVRNCPSSASFAWESIEGPWTEHNISYKAFKSGLGRLGRKADVSKPHRTGIQSLQMVRAAPLIFWMEKTWPSSSCQDCREPKGGLSMGIRCSGVFLTVKSLHRSSCKYFSLWLTSSSHPLQMPLNYKWKIQLGEHIQHK